MKEKRVLDLIEDLAFKLHKRNRKRRELVYSQGDVPHPGEKRKKNKQTNLFCRIQGRVFELSSGKGWLVFETARLTIKNVNLTMFYLYLGPFHFSLLETIRLCMAWPLLSLAPSQGLACMVPFYLRAFAYTVHWD